MQIKRSWRPIQIILSGWIGWMSRWRGNMPIVTVTKIDQTKAGRTRVYFDSRHSFSDGFLLGQGAAPPMGAVIEANTASSDYQGKVYWYLNGWKLAAQPEKPVQTPTSTLILPPVVTKHWAIEPGDCSRFVSNVLGSAIEAGLVKIPSDLHPWVASAYAALQGLRQGKPIDFQDQWTDPSLPQGPEDEDEDDPSHEPF
jgi:hypothetical protein